MLNTPLSAGKNHWIPLGPHSLVLVLVGGFTGVLPRLAKLIAVEQPKHAAEEKHDDFIERRRNGCEARGSAPANGSWDSTVPYDDLDGPNRSFEKDACRSHSISLGSGFRVATLPILATGGRGARKSTVRYARDHRPRPQRKAITRLWWCLVPRKFSAVRASIQVGGGESAGKGPRSTPPGGDALSRPGPLPP